jgi:arginyl-tRNA synthetase
MNIYELVHDKVISVIEQECKSKAWEDLNLKSITIEIPNDSRFGEISTNAAMILAPQLKMSPIAIAKLLKGRLDEDKMFFNVSFAGAGFINLVLRPQVWQNELVNIIEKGDLYAKSRLGQGKQINVEYASPNPTGPMHIGHASGSIYGDALASLLEYVGYKVTRECYINDAGNQIDKVVESIYFRYLELFKKSKGALPKDCYPGEYVIDAARDLKSQYGDKFLSLARDEWHAELRKFAIEEMLKLIKQDLERLGVKHDVFFYESLLHKENRIHKLIDTLKAKGLVYSGTLEKPKGKIDDDWEEREQLLFKSTDFGDDVDRPLQKSDGTWTYFAADAAYLEEKLHRRFDELVLVIGPDHTGYKKRMYAMCAALNDGNNILDIKLSQLVIFLQNGKPLKMSKRAGNFISIEQVLDLVGKDVIRFMMLTRKPNTVMEFDIEKVKEQSKDNPVFYVQYAHARGCSILRNAEESYKQAFTKAVERTDSVNLSLLDSEPELDLIRYLSYWPRQVSTAAANHDPQRLVAYLQALAAKFHSLWNLGNTEQNFRFIIEDDLEITSARLVLVQGVLKIIGSGLRLIGVEPAPKM